MGHHLSKLLFLYRPIVFKLLSNVFHSYILNSSKETQEIFYSLLANQSSPHPPPPPPLPIIMMGTIHKHYSMYLVSCKRSWFACRLGNVFKDTSMTPSRLAHSSEVTGRWLHRLHMGPTSRHVSRLAVPIFIMNLDVA